MENTNIIGGVSPLKARQSSRGGKRAGQATSTSKRRGGFGKSTGKRGGGGRNVGGYNVLTSFTPSAAWTPPASGGTTYIPNPKKPYSYDKDGELKVGDGDGSEEWEYRDTPAEEAKTGNDFADNCYEADGTKKEGHVYTSRKGKQILCAWDKDHVSTGAHDYKTESKKATSERRKKSTTKEGATSFTEWEEYKK